MATDSTTKKIAEKIKAFRLAKGLKQSELAMKAGLNTSYYAKVERAELKPSAETYERIAKVLGVTAADIFPF